MNQQQKQKLNRRAVKVDVQGLSITGIDFTTFDRKAGVVTLTDTDFKSGVVQFTYVLHGTPISTVIQVW